MILPSLFLAIAAQPAYRLSAFIEPTHAERGATPLDGSEGSVPGAPIERQTPEPPWPIELAALFPAGIGSSEQATRASAAGRFLLDIDGGLSPICFHDTPTTCRFARPVRGEESSAASFGVVAHPIHTHAPPAVL